MHIDIAWPRVAWGFDPAQQPTAGTAHATYAHEGTALCGARTPYLGDDWPEMGSAWTLPYGRCPSCAHRLNFNDRP